MNIQCKLANLNQNIQSPTNFSQLGFPNLNPPQSVNSPLNSNIQSSFGSDLDGGQTNADSQANKKKKMTVRMRFTPQEDQELIRLVSVYGDQDWNKISTELSKQSQNVKRTSRQCKDRYVNYLSPEIKNSEWTLEEDQCLILNYLLSPYHWRSMTNLFPGRSEVSIKNRFNHLYKDGMRLLKPIIENSIPKPETNNANIPAVDPKETPTSSSEAPIQHNQCQFLQQFKNDLSGAPVNLNSLKSVIKNLFHYDSFLFNQLFMNGQSIQNNLNRNIFENSTVPQQLTKNNNNEPSNDEKDNNTENRSGLLFTQQNNLDEIMASLESDSEFDPLAFLEMFH